MPQDYDVIMIETGAGVAHQASTCCRVGQHLSERLA